MSNRINASLGFDVKYGIQRIPHLTLNIDLEKLVVLDYFLFGIGVN